MRLLCIYMALVSTMVCSAGFGLQLGTGHPQRAFIQLAFALVNAWGLARYARGKW